MIHEAKPLQIISLYEANFYNFLHLPNLNVLFSFFQTLVIVFDSVLLRKANNLSHRDKLENYFDNRLNITNNYLTVKRRVVVLCENMIGKKIPQKGVKISFYPALIFSEDRGYVQNLFRYKSRACG